MGGPDEDKRNDTGPGGGQIDPWRAGKRLETAA
jgi:hypothetical protein